MDSFNSYRHPLDLAQMTEPVVPEQEAPGPLGLRTVTFSSLIAHQVEMVSANAVKKRAVDNERSALMLFRECFRLTEDSSVSPWLTTLFKESLKKFEEFAAAPRENGKPRIGTSTIPSYLTRLRNLHHVAEELEGEPLTFGEVFDLAVRRWIGAAPGRRINHLVDRSGASPRQISRWRKPDASPRASGETLALIGNLERVLSLRTGALSSHLVRRRANGDAGAPERKMTLRTLLTRVPYIPATANLPPIMQEFYRTLEAYKTTTYAGVNAGGKELLRNEKVDAGKDGKLSRWSGMFQDHMNGFVGWLTLPADLPGAEEYVARSHTMKSMSEDQLDELAPYFLGRGMAIATPTPRMLVDPALLGGYLDWRTLRAGKQSEGHRAVMKYALTLAIPEEGFLWQCPEFACDALGIERDSILGLANLENYDIARKRWKKRCSKLHRLLKTVRKGVKNNSKVRDPRFDLAPILDLDDPAAVLIDIIRRHGAARPVGDINDDESPRRGSLALWFRDELLLRLITSNPLRVGTLAVMAWREDNQANLFQDTSGQGRSGWRLRFDAEDFKNEEGAEQTTYNVPVSASLSKLIDIYLYKARPILLGARPDPAAVFISTRATALGPQRLSEMLNIMAMAYFPGSGLAINALRGHAYRHIIATAWLKSHPGQFRLVAHLLHDKLETVIKAYDHSKPSDGVRAWDHFLSSRLPPVIL